MSTLGKVARAFSMKEYAYVKGMARKGNDLKVSLYPLHGILNISICNRLFTTHLEALNFLREDGRNIVEPIK